MKKLMTSMLCVLMMALAMPLAAQDIPVDPNVRIGTLSNGMKYYIRHNEKPENKVDMQLAINAGSLMEDDDQQGLAHFMEHMNFNGTKHFPDNKLVDFLQSIGIKFGQHLNAYTGFDQTVYMLPVPLDRAENIDDGLRVIEDWAFNATLSGEQIDKERGVVLEELRLGLGADKRMMDKYLPKLLYQSRYAKRLPIGKKQLLETFSYDKIRRFHHDWYRPNLMAVVVVGDIDVDAIEQKIKDNFSIYKNPENQRERKVYEIPSHQQTLVSIVSDPDASMSRAQVYFKNPQAAKGATTVAEYNKEVVQRVYSTMMDNRIAELINSNKPPFTYGTVAYGGTGIRPLKALVGFAITANGEQLSSLEVLIKEMERARRFGFTAGELARAKKQILAKYEKQYNDRAKTKSVNYVSEYINNFLENEPIPGIAWEYEQVKKYAPQIQLNDVNAFAKEVVRDNDRVVILTGPENSESKAVSEAEVLALFEPSHYANLQAYEDKAEIQSLLSQQPKKGKIKKSHTDKALGLTTLTLSNGVQVSYKKTDYKDDEILMEAVSLGGSSLLSNQSYLNTKFAFPLLPEAGLMGYSKTDIQKYLSDKNVSVNLSINQLSERLNGQSSVKDMQTMFELIYAYFTGINKDAEAFEAAKQKQINMYSNMLSNPQFYFSNELNKFIQQNNPRNTNIIPLEEDWARTKYDEAYQIYKDKFADADNFHFYFVGNFDEAQLKDYCATYLASLPRHKKQESTYKDNGYRPLAGNHRKVIKKGKDPKSLVIMRYFGEVPYAEKDELALQALGEIATIKVIEKLREEESGIYGGGAYGGMQKSPYGSFYFMLQFPCGPENMESLVKNAQDELQKLITEGPDAKDLDKYKKGAINDLHTSLKTNKYWLNFFTDQYVNQTDIQNILHEEEDINSLSAEEIKAVAQKYISGDKITAILMPEDGWEKQAAAPATSTSQIDAQTVIDNYIQALGGKAKLEAVKTIMTKSVTAIMGMEIPSTTKRMAPNKLYSKQEVMGQKIVQVFDGEKGYMQQGGNKMDMPANAIDKLKASKLFDALSMQAADYSEVQEAKIDDKACYILVGKDGKHYFDKATGLLYKSETPQGGSQTILEYMEVEGIKQPKKQKISAQGQEMETTTTELKFNEGVEDSDFSM